MKKQYISYMKSGLLLLACAVNMGVAAQGYSPAAIEQLKMKRLWFHSRNAAGTAFDDVQHYSTLNFNYNSEDGNFARPQEGEKESAVVVSSEGFLNLNKAFVWGSFNYAHENMDNAGYNASITDPFRGMPYYVVDTNRSNWRNQFYDLKFRAATPLMNNHWAFGIEGTYKASIAAKQRDPRVDTRFYTLEFIPGITYQLNNNHKFGASFQYTSIKEDSRMSNENNEINHTVYEMYGLGVSVEEIDGFTTNYYGDRFGGSLQYNFTSSTWNVLLEGKYSLKAETAERSYSTPEKFGSVEDKIMGASLTAVHEGKNFTNYMKADFQNRKIKGYQYVNEYDNTASSNGYVEILRNIRSNYKTTYAALDYAISKNRGAEYAWKVEAGVTYLKQDDKYLLPTSIQNYENLTFDLGVKYNWALSNKFNRRLLVDLHGAYNNNLGGEFVYGGTNPDRITVTEITQGLQNYYTSNYYRFGGALTYSQQVKENQRMNMFAKLAYDRMSTSDYEFDGRSFLSVSLGCNF